MKKLAGKKILIVDDEPALREVLADELVDLGAEVTEASNGSEALELASQCEFAAIVTDVRMPGGDGLTLLQKLGARQPNGPVIVLISGYTDLNAEAAQAKGASALFTKPFDIEAVVEALVRLLYVPSQTWVRKDIRHEVEITIRLKLDQTAAPMDGRLSNVGQGGFFACCQHDLPPVGSRIMFSLELGEGAPRVTGSGIVRWARVEQNGKLPPGVGVQFEELSADACEYISRLLQRIRTKSLNEP